VRTGDRLSPPAKRQSQAEIRRRKIVRAEDSLILERVHSWPRLNNLLKDSFVYEYSKMPSNYLYYQKHFYSIDSNFGEFNGQ
jgi:hypothetical protein